jgi:D-sedoheptulose 7-phosphate isomerase
MKTRTLNLLERTLQRYPSLAEIREEILAAARALIANQRRRGMIFVCGNGGSAADSEHIVGELIKGFLEARRLGQPERERLISALGEEEAAYLAEHLQGGFRAMSLTGHPALSSAVANDNAADLIFAQQLYALASPGDLLLAISTSGNSGNVVRAAQVAKSLGVTVLSLTGSQGGRLAALSEVAIKVPAQETFEVQEFHLPVYHVLCAMVENDFYGSGEGYEE